MMRPFFAILLLGLLDFASVTAGGPGDFDGGWLLDSGEEQAVLEGRGAEPPRDGTWWAGSGVSRLFGMPDLPLTAVGVGYRDRRVRFTLDWQRTGNDLVREDRAEARVSVGRDPALGIRVVRGRWSVPGYEPLGHLDVGLDLAFGSGDPWSGRVTWFPTPHPEWHGRSGRREMARVAWVRGGMAFAVSLDRNDHGVPHVGIHGVWRLGPGAGLGLRADPATGATGPCLTLDLGPGLLRTSHMVHPVLGVTHRFMIGLGGPGASPW